MADEALLYSIDRGRAAQGNHASVLDTHARILASGYDPVPLWGRRLALENALGTIRANYTNAELARLGVSSPSELDAVNPVHAIVLAVRGDIADSIELSRNLRDAKVLQERIASMREGSRLETLARDALRAGVAAGEGLGHIIGRILDIGDKASGQLGVTAVAVILIVLLILLGGRGRK